MHERFANRAQAGENPLAGDRSAAGRYGVVSYLDHAAARLARRFDPNTYLAINEAMNHHDVGRGRGGIAAAMGRISAELTIVGLDGDRLYPLRLQEELVDLCPEPTKLQIVHSIIGHDAFLTEDEIVGGIVRDVIER